jgi:sugar (pentulose or hexulose) kinase
MRDLILAVDQGTQSVRAMIFDLHGQLVAKSQIHIQPYYSRQPGWAEQDCEYFWTRLCEACALHRISIQSSISSQASEVVNNAIIRLHAFSA